MLRSLEHREKIRIAKTVDEMGTVHGNLTVFEKVVNAGSHNQTFWKCRCSCGNVIVVSGPQLRGSKNRPAQTKCFSCRNAACSCYPSNPDTPFNDLFSRYRRSAKGRGLGFKLTKEVFKTLVLGVCEYCGLPPSNVRTKHRQTLFYSGIDRVDNAVGYVEGNCVSCCEPCNIAKHTHTKEQFISWVARVYERQALCGGSA